MFGLNLLVVFSGKWFNVCSVEHSMVHWSQHEGTITLLSHKISPTVNSSEPPHDRPSLFFSSHFFLCSFSPITLQLMCCGWGNDRTYDCHMWRLPTLENTILSFNEFLMNCSDRTSIEYCFKFFIDFWLHLTTMLFFLYYGLLC